MHKSATAFVLASAAFAGIAQAQNPQFQHQVDVMKAQWQSGIPMAGAVALETLRPQPQWDRSTQNHFKQGQVSDAQHMAASPRPVKDQL